MSESERPQVVTPDAEPDPEAAMHVAMDAYSRAVATQTAANHRAAQATIESARAAKRRSSSGQMAAVKLPPR